MDQLRNARDLLQEIVDLQKKVDVSSVQKVASGTAKQLATTERASTNFIIGALTDHPVLISALARALQDILKGRGKGVFSELELGSIGKKMPETHRKNLAKSLELVIDEIAKDPEKIVPGITFQKMYNLLRAFMGPGTANITEQASDITTAFLREVPFQEVIANYLREKNPKLAERIMVSGGEDPERHTIRPVPEYEKYKKEYEKMLETMEEKPVDWSIVDAERIYNEFTKASTEGDEEKMAEKRREFAMMKLPEYVPIHVKNWLSEIYSFPSATSGRSVYSFHGAWASEARESIAGAKKGSEWLPYMASPFRNLSSGWGTSGELEPDISFRTSDEDDAKDFIEALLDMARDATDASAESIEEARGSLMEIWKTYQIIPMEMKTYKNITKDDIEKQKRVLGTLGPVLGLGITGHEEGIGPWIIDATKTLGEKFIKEFFASASKRKSLSELPAFSTDERDKEMLEKLDTLLSETSSNDEVAKKILEKILEIQEEIRSRSGVGELK